MDLKVKRTISLPLELYKWLEMEAKENCTTVMSRIVYHLKEAFKGAQSI